MRGERINDAPDLLLQKFESGFDEDETRNQNPQNPPEPIYNRPLTGGHRDERSYTDPFTHKLNFGSNLDNDKKMNQSNENSPVQFTISEEKREKPHQNATSVTSDVTEDKAASDEQPEDADEIFKKMKGTGLMPNAVAMLDGLCKDGLVEESRKLFGLMREKRNIPEVVTYTAVVEGFCKAHKFDDAKRIFRKMQNKGVSPNPFSYGVLVQGLCKGRRLEDAVEFCVEMLEAGYFPNVATFVGLVDGICKGKGLEEATNVIGRLREKGFFVDEKAVREHLEKKGPFLPMVWEAVLGKKDSLGAF
ncbi:pentatricopeptide repeat-containing protein At4g38150 [Telopea speciosissima]|uniref:pentatricopeptide repeat-containing protein At4g38150 n=1 Tax=Telopea speciosissima TaxID=54955 RepID=UPI001CC6068F|nr:pentatricopeptide repeat-containing protein At4g38150 [Telopea speciosissima]